MATKLVPEIPPRTLFLDIEVTGRHPPRDTLYEVAIVNDIGQTVLETLVNPQRGICDSARYRGLTEGDFRAAPTLHKIWPAIEAMVTGCHVVAWNLEHDRKYFPKRLAAAGHASCAMKRFAPIYGDYSAYHNDYVFKSLKVAAEYIGYQFEGPPHHALTDALACRAIWRWMEERDDFNGVVEPVRELSTTVGT